QAAPAPAAQPNQVEINQNPVHTPNPMSAHAPQPEGRAKTVRESLQAAFDRADKSQGRAAKPPERAPAKPAEPKMGHNQPPEATEKLDLRKRPQDMPRGERGQFAPRQREESQAGVSGTPNNAQNNQGLDPQQRPPAKQLPSHAPFPVAPPRISERAKYDWADTPESVR